MAVVLVVDDVKALAEQYAYDLRRVGEHETRIALGGREALDVLRSEPIDCVILDLEMPDVDGFEVLRTLEKEQITIPVIVYTGTGDFDRCTRAIRLGAYSFIDKSESMARVAQEVANAIDKARLRSEVDALEQRLASDTPLIGSSRPMEQLKEHIDRLAAIPSPVLILGESGTGKELVARELHRLGPGRKKPFVAINCAALPENLVESELFGHERGAFTGADRVHRGAFEQGAEGTLFLDEIGELPVATQAKLLRVLEQGEMVRLGGEKVTKVDARVVAATHRDLERDVENGRFRQDLLYRLNVHTLHVPPLRERKSDISEIAGKFVTDICRRFGIKPKPFTPAALKALANADWSRNNVRELRNAVERMIIAVDGPEIGVDAVPSDVRGMTSPPSNGSFAERRTEAERRIIIDALEKHEWHISRTAAALGLADHASLLKIMRRLGVSRKK
ncbi:MAG: sigma-54 dependent transcriptional regulator [Rhodothermia bacterium]|nr:sigma-54 dependent transcriptional regulator [Rhodothermia bacterium]